VARNSLTSSRLTMPPTLRADGWAVEVLALPGTPSPSRLVAWRVGWWS
jgi:hypothetical protein